MASHVQEFQQPTLLTSLPRAETASPSLDEIMSEQIRAPSGSDVARLPEPFPRHPEVEWPASWGRTTQPKA